MSPDVPDGASCFIDANIFYYHFVERSTRSELCSRALARVAAGKVRGFTSAHVLAEAIHKIMLAEAAARFAVPRAGAVRWLHDHAQSLAELTELPAAAAEIAAMPLAWLTVERDTLTSAVQAAQQ